MAKSSKLKVYRTPIGFHDAYVAAPSQAAALRAWGASANLFARGVAEVVTDSKLTKAPLATPGEVVRVARGTAAEHLAALPKAQANAKTKHEAPTKAVKPKPRPRRDALDVAEMALDALDEQQRGARRELDRREAALRRERDGLERAQAAERAKLETARDRARARYDRALATWRA